MSKLHNRGYYRRMRAKFIKKRKTMDKDIYHYYNDDDKYYPHDGMYSKGKIYCSCGWCKEHTRNKGKKRYKEKNYQPSINYKHSDIVKIQEMEQSERDWNESSLYQNLHIESDVDIDYIDANVSDVTLDGFPLDGKYLEHLISLI